MIRTDFVLLIFSMLWFSCQPKTRNERTEAKITPIESIDQLKLWTSEGVALDWKAYEDHVVFLNFWATWCGPCIKEMATIERVQELMSDKNIVFVFATEENFDKINRFKSQNDFNLTFVKQETSLAELNILALPTTYIFDKSGSLVFNETNFRIWDDDKNFALLNTFL